MRVLKVRRVTRDAEDLGQIEELMRQAFPGNERVPFSCLLLHVEEYVDFLSFYEGDVLCGIAWIYNAGDLSFLFYLAVAEGLRGRGYGSQILEYIREMKCERRIVLDIETIDEAAENIVQRKRRKQFYLRNGFRESGVYTRWHNGDFEILIRGRSLTGKEMEGLYTSIEKSWERPDGDCEMHES